MLVCKLFPYCFLLCLLIFQLINSLVPDSTVVLFEEKGVGHFVTASVLCVSCIYLQLFTSSLQLFCSFLLEMLIQWELAAEINYGELFVMLL